VTESADSIKPARTLPEGDGQWHITARTGVLLQVSWHWLDEGRRVQVEMSQVAGPGGTSRHEATLGFGSSEQRARTWVFGTAEFPVDATLSVRQESSRTQPLLWANVPLSANEFYSDAIGQWVPPPPPPPPPTPDWPEPEDDVLLEALPGAADLFPFVWLRPPSARELADALLRYVSTPDPAALPLYVQLAAITGANAAEQRRQAAQTFRGTSQFIGDIASLSPPINQLPAIQLALLADDGTCTLDELLAQADALLGQAVSPFLASAACTTAQQDAWQSVFALALIGVAADGLLAAGLVDMLRTLHYLQALDAGNTALEAAAVRRLLLCATPALPDVVTAAPLSGSASASQWSLIGVGELELVRQHLRGYAPGELAEVVNLMPRERQERHERSIEGGERQRLAGEERKRSDNQLRQSDAASELADTLKEAMCTDGLVRNLSNVTPSYSNLNLMLSGTAAGSGGKLEWDSGNVARLVQRMSEQAAQKVADRTSSQRNDVWREWRERRETQCIDNRDGQRLVGVYRWVDRLMQVWLKPQGRRLVLALQIASPAANWVAQVAAQGPLPLAQPTPLAAFATADGQGYALITPTNYQAWGAQYRLTDLPAPPAEQLNITAQINRAALADTSLLQVPEGYQVTAGSAMLALANTAFGIVASVGGVALTAPAVVTPAQISVNVPAVTSASAGPLQVTPLAPAAAALSPTVFKSTDAVIGLAGAVPVTVISDAPLFGLSVELECQRITLTDPVSKAVVDPLLVDWQMQVYNRLLQAWQDQTRAYDEALSGRIAAASASHTGEVQRQVLQGECLTLLCASSATTEPQMLTGLLDWRGMSWHYDSPIAGIGPRLPDSPAAPVAVEPASASLFRRFLDADLAWVLIPARPEAQAELLFALQWQARWPMPPVPRPDGAMDTPVASSTVVLLEEQRSADEPAEAIDSARPGWTLRLPLPLIYLQEGDALPRFGPTHPVNPWRSSHAATP
jgi:hypothetical protein